MRALMLETWNRVSLSGCRAGLHPAAASVTISNAIAAIRLLILISLLYLEREYYFLFPV
jgi:hypothetical protein